MLHFERGEFLLRETLADSVKLMAVRAEEKGLELIWRVAADVPNLLLGDPLRLRQVVTNLLSNAVKFTTHGEVELCVGISLPVGEQAKLVFAVRDPGIASRRKNLNQSSSRFHRLTCPLPASTAEPDWDLPSVMA